MILHIKNMVCDRCIMVVRHQFEQRGFHILDISLGIIETVHHQHRTADSNINYSSLLSSRLQKDYTFLSRLFSEHENRTIEKFIIHQKIEKVKELLQYGELNINEIAFQMGYSSGAHLSTQFKNVMGMSPIKYKHQSDTARLALDKV